MIKHLLTVLILGILIVAGVKVYEAHQFRQLNSVRCQGEIAAQKADQLHAALQPAGYKSPSIDPDCKN